MIKYYKQCRLEKKTDKGVLVETAWIPEKFAIKHKYLKIKQDDGWKVCSVGERLSEAVVKERSRDYKKQRPASDV